MIAPESPELPMQIEQSRNPDVPVPYFPVEGMTVPPMGLPLMEDAWKGLVRYCAGQPEAIEAFARDTGRDLSKIMPRSPLEAIIDQATGHQSEVFVAFCDWVTETLWGVAGRDEEEICTTTQRP